MPFINTKTNIVITGEQEQSLKTGFGKAMALLNKSEAWLMLNFEDQCRMYFKGNQDIPMVFVEIRLFGKASAEAYADMTRTVTELLSGQLNIQKDKIYVQYQEVDYWGYNGSNF